jgi:hypothetical protein
VSIATNCTRCNCPLQFRDEPPGDGRLLRRSKVPEGYCASCAMSLWLQHDPYSDSLRYVIEKRGGPSILLDRRVIAQMANVLAAGCADAKPQEIDWVSVVIHWDLPFARYPKARAAGPKPPGPLTPQQTSILDLQEGEHE